MLVSLQARLLAAHRSHEAVEPLLDSVRDHVDGLFKSVYQRGPTVDTVLKPGKDQDQIEGPSPDTVLHLHGIRLA